jgi:hypothetical protein
MHPARYSPVDAWKFSPDRRPDWRYQRVCELIDRDRPGRCRPFDDRPTRAMRDFLVQFRVADAQQRQRLAKVYPGPSAAYALHQCADSDLRMTVECRILAGLSDEEIASKHALSAIAVQWYEAIFFHVRDRMEALDWIIATVLNPERSQLSPTQRTLKRIAYFLGPAALEYLLDLFGERKPDRTRDEILNSIDEHNRRTIHRKILLALEEPLRDDRTILPLLKAAMSKKYAAKTAEDSVMMTPEFMEGIQEFLKGVESLRGREAQDQSRTAPSEPPVPDPESSADGGLRPDR